MKIVGTKMKFYYQDLQYRTLNHYFQRYKLNFSRHIFFLFFKKGSRYK